MQYTEVLRALFAATRSGMEFGIDRVVRCIEDLQIPTAPHTIQIAGTNGKGSTANFIAAILQEAGVSTGVFSSPHLLSIRQRFRIRDQSISQPDFILAYEAIAEHRTTLTFFEQITVMAAWFFARDAVDVAIYEVGLGGRLDSTTGLAADIGIVTGIGMDHSEYLGNSLTLIAHEKAGIFRAGKPAIIGLSAPVAIRKQLASHATQQGATPQWVDSSHIQMVPELDSLGGHQKHNAAAAIAAIMALRQRGLVISDSDISNGLRHAVLQGRLEEVADQVWVDGAHNEQAAVALADATKDWPPLVLVVGLSKGKDTASFLGPFQGRGWTLVTTEAKSERAQNSSEIAEIAQLLGFEGVVAEPDVERAIKVAKLHAQEKRVLITGSLLLVGDALCALGVGEPDPVFVSDPSDKVAPDGVDEYP